MLNNTLHLETEEVARILDMDYLEFKELCDNLSESDCLILQQRFDIEFKYVYAEVTKMRAKIITEAFKDTNKPAYREGTMDTIPEERSISPDQVANLEYYLSALNNLYFAISKINSKQEVLSGMAKIKAEQLMSCK